MIGLSFSVDVELQRDQSKAELSREGAGDPQAPSPPERAEEMENLVANYSFSELCKTVADRHTVKQEDTEKNTHTHTQRKTLARTQGEKHADIGKHRHVGAQAERHTDSDV